MPTTEAGKRLNGEPSALRSSRQHWHRPGCSYRVRAEWPCTCGLHALIEAIEAEAAAAAKASPGSDPVEAARLTGTEARTK
jgi:hypothetical protein